jgi:hypothetical protein
VRLDAPAAGVIDRVSDEGIAAGYPLGRAIAGARDEFVSDNGTKSTQPEEMPDDGRTVPFAADQRRPARIGTDAFWVHTTQKASIASRRKQRSRRIDSGRRPGADAE